MVYKEIDLTGSNLSNYKIIEKLGRGGMATVYKAHELSLNRMVALKVLSAKLSDDEEFIKRFQREAQAAAKLNHPNIVQIYAIGEEKGIHFFAMEYIKGKTLSELLQEKKSFSYAECATLIKEVAAGLSLAHSEGLIHRDIKPSNILIDKEGSAKIADFGIAHVQDAKTKLTREGSIIGTPEYLSPEQCEGKTLDGRSDLYSLGVTFYELLTGRTPYEADTPVSMIMKIVSGKFPPISEVKPEVPESLQVIVEKLMQTNPDDRYDSAESLVDALASYESAGKEEQEGRRITTNVLDKAELSGIVDHHKKEQSGGSKKALLFAMTVIILLVGIALAAKFLYFDKQGSDNPSDAEQTEPVKDAAEENAGDGKRAGEADNADQHSASDKKKEIDVLNSSGNEESAVAASDPEALKGSVQAESGGEEKKLGDSESGAESVSKDVPGQGETASNVKSEQSGPGRSAALATRKKGSESKAVTGTASSAVDANNSGKGKVISERVMPKKQLPPKRSVLISISGNSSKGDYISSLIQNRLNRKGYILIDPISAEGKRASDLARHHLVIAVRNMGSRTLKYYGSETEQHTISMSIRMISTQSGRVVKGPVNETARYTHLNMEENIKDAVNKLVGKLSL